MGPVGVGVGVLDDAQGIDPEVAVPEGEGGTDGFFVDRREFVVWDFFLEGINVAHLEFEMVRIGVAPNMTQGEIVERFVSHVTT